MSFMIRSSFKNNFLNQRPLNEYQGSVSCDITELRDLPKKRLKKVYVVHKLVGNNGGDMTQTSCSYCQLSSSGKDVFTPKDKSRSRIEYNDIFITPDLVLSMEVIVKQTLGRKVICSLQVKVSDVVKHADSVKDINYPLSPGGECRLSIAVTPPPALSPTLSENDKDNENDTPSAPRFLRPKRSAAVKDKVQEGVEDEVKESTTVADCSPTGGSRPFTKSLSAIHEPTESEYISCDTSSILPEPPSCETEAEPTDKNIASSDAQIEEPSHLRTENCGAASNSPQPAECVENRTSEDLRSLSSTGGIDQGVGGKEMQQDVIPPSEPVRGLYRQSSCSGSRRRAVDAGELSGRPKSVTRWNSATGASLTRQASRRKSDGDRVPFSSDYHTPPLHRTQSLKKRRDSDEHTHTHSGDSSRHSTGAISRQHSLKKRRSADDEDSKHAVASSDSRVSMALIRKLSGRSMMSEDGDEEIGLVRSDSNRSLQNRALSWLEQQVDEEPDAAVSTTPVLRTPPPRDSEEAIDHGAASPSIMQALESDEIHSPVPFAPASNGGKRSAPRGVLYMPSTIEEEGSDVQDRASHLAAALKHEGDKHELRGPARAFRTDIGTVSSLTVSSFSPGPSPPATPNTVRHQDSVDTFASKRSYNRRGSISTTTPKAVFDEDTEMKEEKELATPIKLETELEDTKSSYNESDEDNHGRSNNDEDFTLNLPGEEKEGSEYWSKQHGTGIKSARRDSRITPRKRNRMTLTTMRSVNSWDEKESVADVVKAAMHERIANEDSQLDEFEDAGSEPGIECWIVDKGQLRKMDTDDIGTFYNADCYILLHTEENGAISEKELQWSVHTWVGSKTERDKITIAAFKAQYLCKYLGNIHLIHNKEGEETDEFIEMLYGNITVEEGSIAQSALKPCQIHEYFSKDETTVRLLKISSGNSSVLSVLGGSSGAPSLEAVALDRSNLVSNSALILDPGGAVIYQWRGARASHVARARAFEAAFSLRSERIKTYPGCQIEVVDEDNEPDEFWAAFNVHQSKTAAKRRGSHRSTGSTVTRETEDHSTDIYGSESEGSVSGTETCGYSEQSDMDGTMSLSCSELSFMDDDDDIIYDMDDIKGYCVDQIEGHTEMQRRQIASQSRVLNPRALRNQESLDVSHDDDRSQHSEEGTKNVSLYRIGYVDGKLETSRLCGINSAGEDFGPPDKSMLDTKGVFILDYNEEVYVWMGRKSAGELRLAGMTVAKALVQHSKPEHVKVASVLEGDEPILFKAKFPGWYESELKQQVLHRRTTRFRPPSPPPKRSITAVVNDSVEYMRRRKARAKHGQRNKKSARYVCRSKIAQYERQPLDDILDMDDGKGVTVVWKIAEGTLRSVPRSDQGHFWTHETYVILYGFTLPDGKDKEDEESSSDEDEERKKPQFVLYFWQGPHSKDKAYTQWKLGILPEKKKEWVEQMGSMPPEIRVQQGKEPLHFFKIFKHRYVVHFPFLSIVRQKNRAEVKVREMQSEILRRERIRSSRLPAPRTPIRRVSGVFSPTSSKSLLNVARTPTRCPSPNSSIAPLQKDHSFRSIDSSVADDVATYKSPVSKSIFHMEMTAGVLLFHVRGSGLIDEDVHAVQIEARSTRLNSSDCFIAIRPYGASKSFVWLWVGRGSQYFEQEAAGSLAMMLLRWLHPSTTKNQVRVVEEGAGEWFNKWIAKSFYRALGGFDVYSNFDLLQTPRYLRPPALQYPQLFLCEMLRGEYAITMVERYSQYDLVESGAAILDAHFALFVWFGRTCGAALRVTSIKVAQKFMGSLRKGACRLDRKVVEVDQDHESAPFISCFHGWCDWELLTKRFVDPRQVRVDCRVRMGLMGDMAAYVGKPIEGLSKSQAETLTKEFKKRQSQEKKKKETSQPATKESIRRRIRSMIKKREEEELVLASGGTLNQEKPKLVADASYNSPAVAPPQPSKLSIGNIFDPNRNRFSPTQSDGSDVVDGDETDDAVVLTDTLGSKDVTENHQPDPQPQVSNVPSSVTSPHSSPKKDLHLKEGKNDGAEVSGDGGTPKTKSTRSSVNSAGKSPRQSISSPASSKDTNGGPRDRIRSGPVVSKKKTSMAYKNVQSRYMNQPARYFSAISSPASAGENVEERRGSHNGVHRPGSGTQRVTSPPFGFVKPSPSPPVPSLASTEVKEGRKPYIDYLRPKNVETGVHSSDKRRTSITRIISAAGNKQRRGHSSGSQK
mmetsp:Transcript_21447/g.31082  ORF Transcript_21447/g.31082 Transcript_21447/m.31082 type:complete len:2204 (-) Transcript_21447:122-6733(-)|eukprot:CAMPEP_0185021678 /NCGR_PEP_ID=MMETSP1103-20130426/4375_1 /TAXON_ID=36769 /ORGANISM="Paraphysomonas bandaiensis, Strain Caron Lab Isolate" /LENGTH=2203 /DNA_ID=CAMNT_0027553357 /DNA_START=144 /DNA_END=6755 /DNA_ORIENTATION=+